MLDLLLGHTTNGRPDPLDQLYTEMKYRGIGAEHIIDIYFPAAISKIGNDWHEGDLDILQATLRMSRLQALLRELGRAWVSDSVGTPTGPRILLVLPGGEQHTLGAMVAANQMRRIGVSVCVCLVPVLPDLKKSCKITGSMRFCLCREPFVSCVLCRFGEHNP